MAVSYITKLLNWKQITTIILKINITDSCFLYNKVTKLKTNHNNTSYGNHVSLAVSYITKLLNWKQITTDIACFSNKKSCFLYNKVTKLKTNHNNTSYGNHVSLAVSYITKLLNWKQITTLAQCAYFNEGCFLYNKVTKLKTNHNCCFHGHSLFRLFPI